MLERVQQEFTEAEDDTDFKDSANGDDLPQGYSEEQVRQIEQENAKTSNLCEELIAKIEAMAGAVYALKDEQE